MKHYISLTLLFITGIIVPAAIGQDISSEEQQLQSFIDNFISQIEPLKKTSQLAEWNAYATGKKEYYEQMSENDLKIATILSNKEDYKKLLAFRSSGKIRDPLLKRQLELMINQYGPKQINQTLLEKIIKKESEVQMVFNTHQRTIDGKEVTENDIYDILGGEKDRTKRKKAWEAQKSVGKKVAPLLIELVKLRNEAARQLGFENYYLMTLKFNDQDFVELSSIFEQLYKITEESFKEKKNQMDSILAKRLGLKTEELMPWDYANPFFQDAPGIFTPNMNKYYKGKDLPSIVSNFYESAGLPTGDILSRSDLYERAGKSPHAFCYCIDRKQDIRLLLNMRDDEESCGTLLHELGHAVYDKYIDQQLPWLCREPAHTFTTEAIAMMFERLIKNSSWLKTSIGVPEKDADFLKDFLREELALQQLVFCRWTEVMFNFERELYKDPNQNLNKLWWDMVEKYQKLPRPERRDEPDWASKIHFSSSPVYYHNYMLGELTASQLLYTLGTRVLGDSEQWTNIDFINKPQLGNWLRENFISKGARYHWSDLIKMATGESLNPKYFAMQFIKDDNFKSSMKKYNQK